MKILVDKMSTSLLSKIVTAKLSIFTHKRSQEYTWLTPNIYPVIVFVLDIDLRLQYQVGLVHG